MGRVTAICWNIENFGQSKYNRQAGGAELIELIAQVGVQQKASIIALLEIRSSLGASIGSDLANSLAGRTRNNTWQSNASDLYGTRLEQYVFVWNTSTVTLYNNSFQGKYTNSAASEMGFKRKSDRPPYLGFFQTVASPQKKIPIAIFHAPGPDTGKFLIGGIQQLANVQEFASQGDTCLIMGDFNIRESNNGEVRNTFGYDAFGNLIGAGFRQVLKNVQSSLTTRDQAVAGMKIKNCYSQPYDTMFIRKSSNGVSVARNGARVEELIAQCMNNAYLASYLAAIDGVNEKASPPSYTTVKDAFSDFRFYVSDHMPVVADINF